MALIAPLLALFCSVAINVLNPSNYSKRGNYRNTNSNHKVISEKISRESGFFMPVEKAFSVGFKILEL